MNRGEGGGARTHTHKAHRVVSERGLRVQRLGFVVG